MSYQEIRNSFENGEYRTLVELAELSFDAVSITSSDNRIVFINKQFEQMTGFNRSEIYGQTFTILQGEKTDQTVLKELDNCLQQNIKFEGKTINYTKNKQPFQMFWRVMPILNNERNQNLRISVHRNIGDN